MQNRFPIRYKFLVVTTLLLVFSLASYLVLASHIFRRDKIELVFDLNRSAVSSLGSEISTLFSGVADKMQLAAILSQESGSNGRVLMKDVLENDANIVFMVASYGFQNLDQVFYSDKKFSETYGLDEKFFATKLLEDRPIPFAEIQTTGAAVW